MMYGLGDMYPPKSFFIYPEPIRVVIGKPFVYQESESAEQFSARVREWFVKHV